MNVSLGLNQAYSAAGSVSSKHFIQTKSSEKVSFFTRATTDGTVQVFRIDMVGGLRPLASGVAVTTGEENRQTFDFPVERAVVVFTDSSGGPGTVSFEAVWMVR